MNYSLRCINQRVCPRLQLDTLQPGTAYGLYHQRLQEGICCQTSYRESKTSRTTVTIIQYTMGPEKYTCVCILFAIMNC